LRRIGGVARGPVGRGDSRLDPGERHAAIFRASLRDRRRPNHAEAS